MKTLLIVLVVFAITSTLLVVDASSALVARQNKQQPTLQPQPSPATTQNAPQIKFTQGGDRSMIYVNNPEQLLPADLADENGVAIMMAEYTRGKVRNWWEHQNRVGDQFGYGVIYYNPLNMPVTIKIEGSGFLQNCCSGGIVFVQLFQQKQQQEPQFVTVDPQQSVWLLRQDVAGLNNSIFTGVVDFEVVTPMAYGTVYNVCYKKFSGVTTQAQTLKYEGYIQRLDPGSDDERKLYKGITHVTNVYANDIDFVVDDTVKGLLPVKYSNFNLTTQSYMDPPTVRQGFYTNLLPLSNPDAVFSDMIALFCPGWGYIMPSTKSSSNLNYPNFGNWAVIYTLSGTVDNTRGTVQRTFNISMTMPPGEYSIAPIAYTTKCELPRGNDYNTQCLWDQVLILGGQTFTYLSVEVPAGQVVEYEANYVLAGPAMGSQYHTITLY